MSSIASARDDKEGARGLAGECARQDSIPGQGSFVPEIGKFLVLIGVAIVVLGIILWSGIGAGLLGKLPGDIRIERGNSVFYFPIVTCIIISVVLSLIFSIFRR